MRNLVGENHFAFIDNCSHYLFVDQQNEFISNFKSWIGKN
jgi:proline iminopeptidase